MIEQIETTRMKIEHSRDEESSLISNEETTPMTTDINVTLKNDAPLSQSDPDSESRSDESETSELPENETADEKDADESEAQSDLSRISVPFASLSTPVISEKDAGDDAKRDEEDTKPLDLLVGSEKDAGDNAARDAKRDEENTKPLELRVSSGKDAGDDAEKDAEKDEQNVKPLDLVVRKKSDPPEVGHVDKSLLSEPDPNEEDCSENDLSFLDEDGLAERKSSNDSGVISLSGLSFETASKKGGKNGSNKGEWVNKPLQFKGLKNSHLSPKGTRSKLVPVTILVGFGMLSCAIVLAASIMSKKSASQGDSAASPKVAAVTPKVAAVTPKVAVMPKLAGVINHAVLAPPEEIQEEEPAEQPVAAEIPATVPVNTTDAISGQPLSADTLVTVPENATDEVETEPVAAQKEGKKSVRKNRAAFVRRGSPTKGKVVKTSGSHVAAKTTVPESDEEREIPTTLASKTVPLDSASAREPAPGPKKVSDPVSTREPASGPKSSEIDKILAQVSKKPTGRKADDGENALPATLNRSQVQASMKKVEPAVKKCASDMGAQGMANVKVNISGADGMINKVEVPSVPEPLRACIVREIRKAKFPRFQNENMAIQYPFVFPFQ